MRKIIWCCVSMLSMVSASNVVISGGIKTPANSHYQIGSQIIEVLNNNTDHFFTLLEEGEGSKSNTLQVLQKKSSLGLTQNDVVIDSKHDHLRSVLALYPQTLFIIYKHTATPKSIREVITSKRIGIGPSTGGTVDFVKRLLQHYDIDSTQYTFVYSDYEDNRLSDSIDVSISLTAFNNHRIEDMVKTGGKIWSFSDNIESSEASKVRGFCMNYPLARPFNLPVGIISGFPKREVATFAIENILVANADMDFRLIQEIVSVLIQKREQLIKKDVVFQFLNDTFKDKIFQFPLHEGTLAYIHRDKPGVIEKYAGFIGAILTIATAISGLFAIFVKVRSMQREHRLQRYFRQLQLLQKKIDKKCSQETAQGISIRANALLKISIKEIMNGRIAVNDKSSVYLEQVKETLAFANDKLKEEPQTTAW